MDSSPPAVIDLTLQGSMLTSNAITPAVRINGYPVPASYGFNRIPMSPGRVRVDISCQWLVEYGRASLEFEVRPGEAVPVFYAAPLHQFSAGSIGYEPQQRRGWMGLLLILAAIVVLIGGVVVLAALL